MPEQAKPTPGPWIAGGPRYDNQYRVWVADERGRSIAETGRTYYGQDEAVAVANARLIAAAVNCHDELLAACRRQAENIERWIETGEPAGPEESESIYNQLKAAIGKAEGSNQ